jgi:hypothetical protein
LNDSQRIAALALTRRATLAKKPNLVQSLTEARRPVHGGSNSNNDHPGAPSAFSTSEGESTLRKGRSGSADLPKGPDMQMIFDFRLFWRMTIRSFYRTAGTYGPLNRNRFLFLALFYPIWGSLALLGWIGFALDEVFFPAYRKQAVEKPLFIVSNFRSGSTFAQRTLALDAANFSCMTTGEIYLMPSITQRRIFNLLARLDALIGHTCENLLRRLDDSSLRKLKIHPFSLFDAEEDEHILFYAWSTFLIGFVFPYLDELPPYQYFDTAIPRAERQRIMTFYRACVKRHLYATNARHYMAKNPLFSAKIESLLETFPDARILYLVRNPLETLPSTVSLFKYMWRLFSLPPEKYPHRDEILTWAKYWYDHPLEVIDRDLSQRCLIVKYDDLVRSPASVMHTIYRRFGYAESPELEGILHDVTMGAQSHVSSHSYSLEAMGFSHDQIVQEFAHIFERFGFAEQELEVTAPTN